MAGDELFRLSRGDTGRALLLLRNDPIQNVSLVVELERRGLAGLEAWGWSRDDRLRGLVQINGQMSLYVRGAGAVAPIANLAARRIGRYHVLAGEKNLMARLWSRLQRSGLRARQVRENVVYALHRGELRASPGAPIRPARPTEVEEVFEHAVAMYREDIGTDPVAGGGAAFRRRVVLRIESRATFVWKDAGKLRFKADVGSRTREVAQIEGVWTPPPFRRQAYATRGLAELCHRLLGEVPTVSLYVNAGNLGARRLYERLGFRRHMTQLAVWL